MGRAERNGNGPSREEVLTWRCLKKCTDCQLSKDLKAFNVMLPSNTNWIQRFRFEREFVKQRLCPEVVKRD